MLTGEEIMIENIAEKNRLRYEIKQKKQTLAKMVRHAEMLEETLVLKSEIETLENELNSLN